jgi:hypothetical protein
MERNYILSIFVTIYFSLRLLPTCWIKTEKEERFPYLYQRFLPVLFEGISKKQKKEKKEKKKKRKRDKKRERERERRLNLNELMFVERENSFIKKRIRHIWISFLNCNKTRSIFNN